MTAAAHTSYISACMAHSWYSHASSQRLWL